MSQTRAAFDLLADFYAHGLTEDARSTWSSVPDARPLLARLSPSDAAEAHTRLLVLELPPHAGIFLDPAGLIAGRADHLSGQFRRLAARVDITSGDRDEIHTTEGAGHPPLLCWLPAWIAGARTAHDVPEFFTLVFDLTFALVLREASADESRSGWKLPAPTDVLADPKAGLAAIARHLALPCQAGGYFPRSALVRVGRELNLPAGFGSRAETIEGLLIAAAHYRSVGNLCAALTGLVRGWRTTLLEVQAAECPGVAEPWLTRCAATEHLLARLAEGART